LESTVDDNHIRKHFYRFVLILCGLTGIVSCLLSPLYIFRAYVTERREAFIQGSLIFSCAILQIAIALFVPSDTVTAGRFSLPKSALLGFILLNKNVILPIFGYKAAKVFPSLFTFGPDRGLIWLLTSGYICLVIYALFLAFLFSRPDKDRRIFIMGSHLILTLLVTYLASGNKIKYVLPHHSQRYFYVPNVLLMMMIFLSIKWNSKSKFSIIISLFLTGLLIAGILNGIAVYPTTTESGEHWPSWQEEVALWRKDHSYPIKIWPPGWHMELKERTR
jgi:hypothetical protein